MAHDFILFFIVGPNHFPVASQVFGIDRPQNVLHNPLGISSVVKIIIEEFNYNRVCEARSLIPFLPLLLFATPRHSPADNFNGISGLPMPR